MQKANGELVPGGLAMVIGCVIPENTKHIGQIILLGDACLLDLGPGFIVDEWTKPDGKKIAALSRHLIPINPEADPLHVSEREKCTND